MTEVTSRHLRNTSELLVMAPIKQGFVEIADRTVSYASRLRMLLSGLYELRRAAAEQELAWVVGPIEQLQTIWNSQWTVLPDNRHLLVTVAFDRSWEEYFQLLVEKSGPSLDLIFCHCEGYADSTCVTPLAPKAAPALRFQGFSEYVRRHQVRSDFYYAANPDLTSEDVAYLRKLGSQDAPSAQAAAELRLGKVEQEFAKRQFDYAYPAALIAASKVPGLSLKDREDHAKAFVKRALEKGSQSMTRRALRALRELQPLFPTHAERDPCAKQDVLRPAREVFDLGVRNLLPSIETLELEPEPAALNEWVQRLQQLPEVTRAHAQRIAIDGEVLEQVQGNILAGYGHTTHGCAVLLRCADAAAGRAFLAKMAARVTSHAAQLRAGDGDAVVGNLAITFAGLQRLGVREEILRELPKEFRDGMESRAAALGDVGYPNHPEHWQLPTANYRGAGQPLADSGDPAAERQQPRVRLASVDFIATFETEQPHATHEWLGHPLRAEVEQLARDGAQVLHVQLLQRQIAKGGPLEHFGFVDGISQPVPDAILDGVAPAAPQRDLVALGEVLLGYPDNRNELASCADPKHVGGAAALFKNGSFLVVRKLAQDVAAFNAFAERNAAATEHTPAQIKEWTLGRSIEDSSPLVTPGVAGNDFTYDNDPNGRKCPFHAHIRRANPRTVDAHGRGEAPRIMRRGFSYGPRYESAPNAERGLLFMAYNASIAGQYEVLQRWINGGNSVGILSAQNDLYAGSPHPGTAPHWAYGHERWQALSAAPQPFVRVCWGLYAFAPSREVMARIGELAAAELPKRDDPRVEQGREIIAALHELEALDGEAAEQAAIDGWKNIIEDVSNAERAALMWAAIRADGGVLRTPYGVLVASADGAREVLSGDGTKFSVREYWQRLRATTGEHYISFDPAPRRLELDESDEVSQHREYEQRLQRKPGYAELAGPANELIEKAFGTGQDAWYDPAEVFDSARGFARGVLDRLTAARGPNAQRTEISLRKLAVPVIAMLCRRWFGIPKVEPGAPDELAALSAGIAPFILASQYSFQPHPIDALAKPAQQVGAAWRAAPAALDTSFEEALRTGQCPAYQDNAAILGTLAGSVVGFAAPAIGSVVLVLVQWADTRQLGAIAERWKAAPELAWLRAAVIAALYRTPVPPLLSRTAMNDASVCGHELDPGERVVVGLASAALDDPEDGWHWLFGGSREVNPHGCPAREAAVSAIAGIAAALLERPGLERSFGATFTFG